MTRCSASFFSLLSKFPALDPLRPAERFQAAPAHQRAGLESGRAIETQDCVPLAVLPMSRMTCRMSSRLHVRLIQPYSAYNPRMLPRWPLTTKFDLLTPL